MQTAIFARQEIRAERAVGIHFAGRYKLCVYYNMCIMLTEKNMMPEFHRMPSHFRQSVQCYPT